MNEDELEALEAMNPGDELVDARGRRWERGVSGWTSGITYASSYWLLKFEGIIEREGGAA